MLNQDILDFPISICEYYDYDYKGDNGEYIEQSKFWFWKKLFNQNLKDSARLKELRKMLKERNRDIINCYKYFISMRGFSFLELIKKSGKLC